MNIPISVTVLTKNSSKTLAQTLESVRAFDEVVLLDSGSSDQTLDIAKKFDNVKIFESEFLGFGPMHRLAVNSATHDWILSLDSDEVLSRDLLDEIAHSKLENHTIYSLPFHNFFNGKWIKWCGWYPDRHLRLFNRTSANFSSAFVHEKVEGKNCKVQKLQNPVNHFSYGDVSDFLKKMQTYSALFAQQNCGKKKASVISAMIHGLFAFVKSYLIKRGFMGGYEGFIISLYNGHTAFYKYIKLREANRRLCSSY